MKRIFIILCILSGLSVSVCAQTSLREANDAFAGYEYTKAITKYKSIFELYNDDVEQQSVIAYKIGYCYKKTSQPRHAELWFQKAADLQVDNPLVFLYLADAQRMNEKFDKAIENYEYYKSSMPQDNRAEKGIESCNLAQEWMNDPTEYVVTNLAFVNTEFMDYCPFFFNYKGRQGIYFSSTMPDSRGDEIHGGTGQSFADVYVSYTDVKKAWTYPKPLAATINTQYEEGCASVTSDNKELFYTSCKYEEKKSVPCRIFSSEQKDAEWEKGTRIELADIKKDTYDYAHPSISHDGKTLFFTSNRKGGYGGYDIWYTTRPDVDEPWERIRNAGGVINTPGNEVFPYLRPDSTLFFASDGHLGMGGLDIYRVNSDAKGRDYVLNMLYPINSSADDYGISFYEDTEEGFLTSNRKGTQGYDDIYHFKLPIRDFMLTGTVKNEMTEEPIPYANIRLIGSDGSSIETSANEDGEYSFELNPQTNYVILALHDNFLNSKYKISTYGLQKDKEFKITMYMTKIDIPVEIPNILYDVNRWELRPESIVALEKLLEILRDNPHIVIELSSHTDYRVGAISNEELSQRRAQSVVDFLIARGIKSDRLYPKGYGATRPKKIDLRHSELYSFLKLGDVLTPEFIKTLEPAQQEIAHQINRRTEFRVIATDYVK
ncbi:MAG: OmpA family protein [Bacteroidales bacterium]